MNIFKSVIASSFLVSTGAGAVGIPVETVEGIVHGWRFSQEHPALTGSVVIALFVLAFIFGVMSFRIGQRKNILRAASLSLVLGASGFYGWAYATRGPGLSAALESATAAVEGVSYKLAHKVENLKVVMRDDGSATVTALLTYADGQQENCTFVINVMKDKCYGNEICAYPQSRKCTPVVHGHENN
jgi:hypothetical protein